jgi:CheY-like chemotaxis protein
MNVTAGGRQTLLIHGVASSWGGRVAELVRDGFETHLLGLNVEPKAVAEMARRNRAVVIVDLELRLTRGMETIAACRRSSAGTPLVVIADSPSVELARSIRRSGVFYLALSPVSMDELRRILEDAFDVLGSKRSATSFYDGLKRILLIDDDPEFSAATGRLLRDHGYSVTVAASRREGLRSIAADRPDLVVLDVMMESELASHDVTDTFEHALEDPDFRSVPILRVSRIKTEPVTRPGPGAPGSLSRPDAYLSKPLDIPVFLQTVRSLLGSGAGREVTHV